MGRGRSAMAALLPGLLLGALLGAAAAALLDLPCPSNFTCTLNVRHCELNVTWKPIETEDNCVPKYESDISTGVEPIKYESNEKPSRTVLVPLGKKVIFRARNSCSSNGEWIYISLPQNGIVGTGATNISCIWHNLQNVVCTWQRGKNASQNTAYNLTAWYQRKEEVVCTNYTKEDDTFRCAFDLKADWPGTLSISIQGSSSNIQPVCVCNEKRELYEFPIKLDPPSIVNITKSNNGVKLQWTPSIFKSICYAVNISNDEFNRTEIYRTVTEASIPLQPKLRHTFRVKAIFFSLSGNCTEGLWSDWSKAVEWGEENLYDNSMFSVLLYILIPLCVAILTIIVLIYLKRIKLLILPTIPEPGKFVKQLFEEHSEDLQKPPPEDPIKDEQTHLLVFVQTSGNEN